MNKNGLVSKLSLFMLVLTLTSRARAGFFNEHEQGWFWYQNSQEQKTKKEAAVNSSSLNATEQMNALRKEVEDSANLAILYPTEENLVNYANHYYRVINQSQQFTDAYKLMLLKHPAFDYSLKFPLNPISHKVYDKEKERLVENTVRDFAKSHGFFFFFSSQCPHCQVFASTVKAFKDKYQMPVIAVSLDGGSLLEFPQPQKDNYAATRFKVTTLPALFAVNPKAGSIAPIANGPISIYELEENVFRLSRGAP